MKTFATLALCALLPLAATAAGTQSGGTISLEIEEVEPDDGGELVVAVYEHADFPEPGEETYRCEVELDGYTASCVLTNIAPETYAILVFQDTDDNDELTENFIGVASEVYGYSWNKRPLRGDPDFDDISFTIHSNETVSLTIRLE